MQTANEYHHCRGRPQVALISKGTINQAWELSVTPPKPFWAWKVQITHCPWCGIKLKDGIPEQEYFKKEKKQCAREVRGNDTRQIHKHKQGAFFD